MKLLLLTLLAGFIGQAVAGPVSAGISSDFTGHYELAKSGPRAFALDITQKGKNADVSFSAANEDGSGAAPEGGGKGQLNDKGELVCKFTDLFDNTGTLVLRQDGKIFRLSMQMNKVTEPRAVVHYGEHALKRTATKPQSTER